MSETCHIGVPEVDLLEARPCADIAAASDRPALAVAHNNLTCGITTFQAQPRASQPEPRSSSQKSPAPRRRPGAAAPPGLTPNLCGGRLRHACRAGSVRTTAPSRRRAGLGTPT